MDFIWIKKTNIQITNSNFQRITQKRTMHIVSSNTLMWSAITLESPQPYRHKSQICSSHHPRTHENPIQQHMYTLVSTALFNSTSPLSHYLLVGRYTHKIAANKKLGLFYSPILLYA